MMNPGPLGCPANEDFEVAHAEGQVNLRFWSGRVVSVSSISWVRAVVDFSAVVRAFYAAGPEKVPSEMEAAGYRGFMAEWDKLHREADTISRQARGQAT
jgi:hypothetical protein